MHDNAKVLGVQVIEHRFRIGKISGMPREFTVPCVPSRRREFGAEVDECITR